MALTTISTGKLNGDMMVEWTIINDVVVVTVQLPDGHKINLSKTEALALGKTINNVAESAPKR
jgi:hypothetical protein